MFSPVSGLVVEKMDQALEGMYVKPGMNLYKIVDLSTVWVEAEIFESQIPWLRVGQSALWSFPISRARVYREPFATSTPFSTRRPEP